jgi:hypothetical protein
MVVRRIGLAGGLVLPGILIFISLGLAQGADPWVGTWRLNLEKSKFDPGPPPQRNTLTIEVVAGGAQKHTFDGANAKGEPTHSERVTKFDGSDVPVQATQPPSKAAITNAFRRLDSRSFEVVSKSEGKVTTTTRVVISADGKTMTQTATGTNAQGQKVNSVTVYEKQ